MPFPSAGCRACKVRRVKCDETRPICQRCARSGRSCQGMISDSCLPIHNENSYASGQKKRPRGPRSIPHRMRTEFITSADPVLHRPLIDLKTKAILYFSDCSLQTPKGTLAVLKGVTNDILDIWSLNGDNPLLELSVSSVALAVYSRTQQQPQAAVEASARYHHLLRLQQRAIAPLDQSNIDACLIAIFFMSRFEEVVYSATYPKVQPFRKLQSFSHHDGALAILKYWKQYFSHTYPATDIIKYTRRGMIRSAILRSRGLPSWILDGGTFGERNHELGYDSITVRTVNLRYRLSILLDSRAIGDSISDEEMSTLLQLRDEVLDLDIALRDWANLNLNRDGYKVHDLSHMPSLPQKYFYSPIIYSYSGPAQASAWTLYYGTRMLIYSTVLKIHDLVDIKLIPATNDQNIDYSKIMDRISSDLASSLPFSLQRITFGGHEDAISRSNSITVNSDDDIKPYMANIMIWPLSLAANLGGVDIKYKKWFTSLLAQLGRITGIALLESAETSSWPEL